MKRVFVLFGLLAVLLLPLHGPHAHEVRPGFLELRAVATNVFLMTWKVPALGTFRLGMSRGCLTPATPWANQRRCRRAVPSSSMGG